jgi:ribosome-binding factor A
VLKNDPETSPSAITVGEVAGQDRSRRRRRLVASTSSASSYPRSARINEVLREILGETIERLADTDDRLSLLTVTGVDVDPDLRHARVWLASLSEEQRAALEAVRGRLQAAVGRQVHLKRTPLLSFAPDPAVSTGERVEAILRQLRLSGDNLPDDPGR